MPPLFTRFVHSLDGPPDEGLALDVWQRLREILEHELKRRGLWHNPPSYLGIFGSAAWSGAAAEDGAIEELVAECYGFIFVDRLERLKAQLRVKPNIEGLVLLNVRHFFLERQKEHDPLGYRVYEMVHAAIREAIAAGELFVLAGDPEVRNDTLLGFAAAAPVEGPPERLAPLLDSWCDALLPELVLARGQHQAAVWARLRHLVLGLERQGIAAFRFRDLLASLKSETRRRWAALLAAGSDGAPQLTGALGNDRRTVPPETSIESRQSLERISRHVETELLRAPTEARTREYLALLWRFLRLSTGTADRAEGDDRLLEGLAQEESFSHRQLAQILGIPRDRLPGLFATLRRWITEAEARARTGRRNAREEDGTAVISPSHPAPKVGWRALRSEPFPLSDIEREGAR